MDSGEELYQRYREGDESAFDGIIALYKNGLILFLYRLVGDWHAAEDLSEDCFVELIVHPRRYRFQSGLKTYLFAIARHKALSHLRRHRRAPSVSLEDAGPLADDADPAGRTDERERRAALLRALDSLPKDYGEALYLRYFEELSAEEIARVMRKNLKQVYNLSSRAKTALKSLLERDEFFDEIR